MNYRVRPMREGDLPQAMEIEREAFPTQWPPTPFKRELQNKLAYYLVVEEAGSAIPQASPPRPGSWMGRLGDWLRGERECQESENGGYIVGMVGFWLLYDEAHITSIAVRESHRRRGLGELLLVATLEQARAMKARVVTLEVRVSNSGAQALYEKYSFKRTGIRRGYYTDNGEDGYIMTTNPLDTPSFRDRYQGLREALARRLNTPHPPPTWPLG